MFGCEAMEAARKLATDQDLLICAMAPFSDPRRTRTTVPSRIRRMIGSSVSERAFQASQSPLVLRHTRLTVSLPLRRRTASLTLCYPLSWRDLRRRANANSDCFHKQEITPPSNFNRTCYATTAGYPKVTTCLKETTRILL